MSKFISFSSDISSIVLPKKIAYPYNYSPNIIAKVAVNELQEYLKNQTDFVHEYGMRTNDSPKSTGKMFGVLVVKSSNGSLGYLTAFSGKIANSTLHEHFVPPVFNVIESNNFYKKTEVELNEINDNLKMLTSNKKYLQIKNKFDNLNLTYQSLLEKEHNKIKQRRKLRKVNKQTNNQLNINEEFYLKEYKIYLNNKMYPIKVKYENLALEITKLQKLRKEKSAWVQQKIFQQYRFLNAKGKSKNLLDIFNDSNQKIPAGAGDCCAPKLFNYAFSHNFTPIALAEFWWGKPLITSVRKHGYFYPACTGKCKPILTHMLQETLIGPNPLLKELQVQKEIPVIYSDKDILIINKPHEYLSVSGKEVKDSVYSRIKQQFPEATGPLIVHRIDMSTSGILLIAKNKKSHKILQQQFLNKVVKKRYVAILNGTLKKKEGIINLPLRVDLDDRPKQLVCYEHGKKALTTWKTIDIKNNRTKVYFFPISGRTHQLRVHAAHSLGLNTPILGDELYGIKSDRLHLHAEKIGFFHPISEKWIEFIAPSPF
ncbi:RluA family pseudouridine synthase [Tenacibaculum sp.]|nr:RluA family pseudouridine synthase [Tenacibaculum sp.]